MNPTRAYRTERWWKNPKIIGPIAAAAGAIIVAIIQLLSPTIEQHTFGPGSPAIGKTGGDITIIQQQDSHKP
jgi:purine-cytosine permease-like protein